MRKLILLLSVVAVACGDKKDKGPPPSDATVLSAEAGNTQVVLRWAAVDGATSYDIARGTSSGGETKLATVSSAGYIDTTTPGETGPYFYTVTPHNAGGDGPVSNEASARAYSLDTWHRRYDAQSLQTVIFANNMFVAAGTAGRVFTSPDGATWTAHDNVFGSITGLAYGAGLFVAVTGTSIQTSPDGITWTSREPPSDALTVVAYGGVASPHFVAAGNRGQVATSPDGITWTAGSTLTDSDVASNNTGPYNVTGIAYGDDTLNFFVVTATDKTFGHGYVFYVNADASLNDVHEWAHVADGAGQMSNAKLNGVGFGRIRLGATRHRAFHAVGASSTWIVGTLVGSDLSFVAGTAGTGVENWQGVIWDGVEASTTVMKLVGHDGKIASCTITACVDNTNGWVAESVPSDPLAPDETLFAGAYANGAWVAVGDNELIDTTNAAAWNEQHRSNGTDSTIFDVAAIDSTVIAVGTFGLWFRSTDGGTTFTAFDAHAPGGAFALRAFGGRWFAAGNGVLGSSNDGQHFTYVTAPTIGQLSDVAWNGSLFVAAGAASAAYTSADGASWTAQPGPGSGAYLNRLAWDGASFLGVDGINIWSTTDGVTWTKIFTDTDAPLADPGGEAGFIDVASNGDVDVAVGAFGRVFSSADHGATWTQGIGFGDAKFLGARAIYTGGAWVAVGFSQDDALTKVLTSPDALTWTEHPQPISFAAFGMGVGAGRVFVSGFSGDIISTY